MARQRIQFFTKNIDVAFYSSDESIMELEDRIYQEVDESYDVDKVLKEEDQFYSEGMADAKWDEYCEEYGEEEQQEISDGDQEEMEFNQESQDEEEEGEEDFEEGSSEQSGRTQRGIEFDEMGNLLPQHSDNTSVTSE